MSVYICVHLPAPRRPVKYFMEMELRVFKPGPAPFNSSKKRSEADLTGVGRNYRTGVKLPLLSFTWDLTSDSITLLLDPFDIQSLNGYCVD
jgi:hypothetical protein